MRESHDSRAFRLREDLSLEKLQKTPRTFTIFEIFPLNLKNSQFSSLNFQLLSQFGSFHQF
jgi:hypothetical protein